MCCDLWLFPTSTDLFCWRKCVVTRSYVSNHFLFFFSLVMKTEDDWPLQAQDWRLCMASQKGIHSPLWQRPLSTHTVLSSAFSGGGHSLLLPDTSKKNCLITGSGFGAGLVLHQQVELTCAGGCAFACGTNGFLTPHSCLLKRAVPAARTVSVTVEPQKTMSIKSFPHRDFFFMRSS